MAGALPREKRSFKPRALAWGGRGQKRGMAARTRLVGHGARGLAQGRPPPRAVWSHREDAQAGAQPLEEAIAPQGDAAEHRACASCPGPAPPPRG